jgi:hypothetical protein
VSAADDAHPVPISLDWLLSLEQTAQVLGLVDEAERVGLGVLGCAIEA